MLGLLRRNLSACDPALKEAAYMSLVRPLIEYASCAWDPHTEQLIAEVEKIQRRAARFVLSDYESYEPGSMSMMLKRLGWPPLKLRRQMDRVILFNKGLNNLASLPFLELLKKPTRRSRHTHGEHYIPLSARTNLYKYSFLPKTLINWNNLPQSIIDLSTNPGAFRDSIASYYCN